VANQFEFPSAAALARLKDDALSASAVGTSVSAIASVGSKVAELAGFHGAAPLTGIIADLKRMAAAKDEANLTYFGEQLVDDIGRLYRLNEEMRVKVERLYESQEFNEAVANATLHITHTNVEIRIARVARLIANGVACDDLVPERLDDMMRAAVELTDADIALLAEIYRWHNPILSERGMNPTKWFGDLQQANKNLFGSGFLDPKRHLNYRSSYSRLESLGLIQQIPSITSLNGIGFDHYALLLEGKRFYERLREIGKGSESPKE
jgi:hypothetical protein